ncbi:hypothetical protein K474DRAFT_1678968 [Panus rudis PR-1116 ss-1]|nr:hypothetical protein K474DRAFT_1678968 [Panus rudis PR-1116 ss-1]
MCPANIDLELWQRVLNIMSDKRKIRSQGEAETILAKALDKQLITLEINKEVNDDGGDGEGGGEDNNDDNEDSGNDKGNIEGNGTDMSNGENNEDKNDGGKNEKEEEGELFREHQQDRDARQRARSIPEVRDPQQANEASKPRNSVHSLAQLRRTVSPICFSTSQSHFI